MPDSLILQSQSTDIARGIERVAQVFNCNPVIGVFSQKMRRFIYSDNKSIPNINSEDHVATPCTVEVNDVFSVEIMMSSGKGKVLLSTNGNQRPPVILLVLASRSRAQSHCLPKKCAQEVQFETQDLKGPLQTGG
jgi:methionine aminopeptidase